MKVSSRHACLFGRLLAALALAGPAGGTCTTTGALPNGDTAASLIDPSGHQVALFDLTRGGVLASLKYNGVERLQATTTAGGAQPFMIAGNYVPIQAGDNAGRPAPVVGAMCISPTTLLTLSGMTDYNAGVSGTPKMLTVFNDAVVAGQYATPYTLTNVATFVPNPSGTPASYLRVKQVLMNNSTTEYPVFSFRVRGFVPFVLNPTNVTAPAPCLATGNCASEALQSLVVGSYPTTGRTNGFALALAPSAAWAIGSTGFSEFWTDSTTYNSLALTNVWWRVLPQTALQFEWYALVGDWAPALSFAQRRYYPRDTNFVTRREAAQLIIDAIDASLPSTSSCATPRYSDVPCADPDWQYIEASATGQLLSGCDASHFCPNTAIVLEDLAAALTKAKYGPTTVPPYASCPQPWPATCGHDYRATDPPVWSDMATANSFYPFAIRFWGDRAIPPCRVTPSCSCDATHFCSLDSLTGSQFRMSLNAYFPGSQPTGNHDGNVARFYTITPCRLIDTRQPTGTFGGPSLQGGATRTFPIGGYCGIPNDAIAIAANLTAVNATSTGDLQVIPAGMTSPGIASLWLSAVPIGSIRANFSQLVLTGGNPYGSIAIVNEQPVPQPPLPNNTTNVIVDISGYYR
jgi:hypothetical protein